MVRFGGHRAAAGVTVSRDRVAEFAARFNAVARERLEPADLVPQIHVDIELSIDDVTPELEGYLKHFEPCGVGNPAPALLARGVSLAAAPRAVAQDGLKLRLARELGDLDAIAWAPRTASMSWEAGAPSTWSFEWSAMSGRARATCKPRSLISVCE